MAFETKPGHGALFRNKYKEQENHPDARGDAVCPLCSGKLELASWNRKTRSGESFRSLKLSEPRQRQGEQQSAPQQSAPQNETPPPASEDDYDF